MKSVRTFVVAVACCLFLVESTLSAPRPRFVFHDDAQSLREAADVEDPEAFLRSFIRREIGDVPITTFCYLAAMPDLCFYDSKVGEVRGARLKKATDPYRAIQRLQAAGTDVLKVVISELRPRGMEILAAIRMGDTHHRKIDPDDPRCSKLLLDRPEYVIQQPDKRTNETALDYRHDEVRAYRLGIIRELVETYDIDGVELNFCRWGKHFPSDLGREHAPVMTAFVGEIRAALDAAAKNRGRARLTLGVRVPEGIAECWLAGLDPETWVRRGWIEYLTVATYNETDPQVSAKPFVAFAKPNNCQVLVAMGNLMGGVWNGLPKITGRGIGQFRDNYSGMLLTVPEARACAANYYADGADGISFWNISCNMGTAGKFCEPDQQRRAHAWMRTVCDRANLKRGPRRYHYLPIYKWSRDNRPPVRNYAFCGRDQSPLGTRKLQILRFTDETTGRRQAYRFLMADGRNGEGLSGRIRFRVFHLRAEDRLMVDVNGKKIGDDHVQRRALDAAKIGLPGAAFEIELKNRPLLRGNNELGLTLETKGERQTVPYMEELDITVDER